MKKALYLECSSGISGDMSVAALLDLGADEKLLRNTLESLPLDGYQIAVTQVHKSGIAACDFHVILDKNHENHDHDMNYLHGHEHSHDSSDPHCDFHSHELDHRNIHLQEHSHEHSHKQPEGPSHEGRQNPSHLSVQEPVSTPACHRHSDPALHHHSHIHRNLEDILAILRAGSMTPKALAIAEKIFSILAEAESKAHGVPLHQVHFHEVGAVDSIVDIAAFAVCLDMLGYSQVFLPVLCEGRGTIRCQHGIILVPVPAVTNIVCAHHLPLSILNADGELVTPTGAAIAAAVSTDTRLPDKFHITRVGIGAGKRNYETPGILRAMEIEY